MSITISQILQSSITWISLSFGLIMGSFFNVCIYRIPRNSFWQSHRSKCIHCGSKIPAWLNIPVISFLVLRGKSRCCSKPIPFFYPLVELFSGLLFVYLYWRFPFLDHNTLSLTGIDLPQLLRFAHALIFSSLLLICSVIDMQHMIIPDLISLPMILSSPLVALVHPELTMKSSLIGALVGGLGVYFVAWLYILIRKKDGIGMGDAKLLAAIGGWLGYESLLPTVFMGSITGSFIGLAIILKRRKADLQTEIPFGPFLSLGAVLFLLSPIHWLEALSAFYSFFNLE